MELKGRPGQPGSPPRERPGIHSMELKDCGVDVEDGVPLG